MKKGKYSDKPLGLRLLFFITGFTNFLMGYTIYYLFSDDKSKEWQLEFVQRGATFGLSFVIIGIALKAISVIIG